MGETKKAKLFKNGASQAVRLPAEFRFDADEVYATRDDRTGDLVLSTRPGTHVWSEFFELVHSLDIPKDFLSTRPMNTSPKDRHLFESEAHD